MSLTRYLPPPSDRMGILWTLLQIRDAVILEYGTAGTTAYAQKIFRRMGIDSHSRLFTTEMNEDDVVMGDTARLEKAIVDLDKKYHPKVIFVMASSVSSVIGSDVKGVCNYMQDEVASTIIHFPQGGFGGDFSSGLKAAYTSLISNLATEDCTTESTFNLLGVSAMTPHAQGDVAEIQSMMNTYFNLKPHAILSLDTDLTKIATMSKATVNLVLSYEGLEAAKLLQERFGTPYVYGFPMGYQGTRNWLLEIANALEVPLDKVSIPPAPTYTGKIAAYASYDVLVALQGVATELGAEVAFLLSTHNISKVPNKNPAILYCKKEKEKIQQFESLSNTFVLAEDTFLHHANSTNHLCDLEETLPTLAGFEGTRLLLQALTNQ